MPNAIKPSEISEVLLSQLRDIKSDLQFEEIGKVLQVSDGVVRIYGLDHAEAGELLDCGNGVMAVVMNLEPDNDGPAEGRGRGPAHPPHRLHPGGRGPGGPRRGPARQSPGRHGQHRRGEGRYAPGAQGAGRHLPPARERAAADGPQGHRRDDSDRPRPARAHHRRPPDRQDGRRDRHHHQPAGQFPEGGSGLLHLCGRGPEGLHRREHRQNAPRPRRDGLHHRRRRHRRGPGRPAVLCAFRRRGHRRILPRHGPPRPRRV